MAWNNEKSILRTGDSSQAVEREADVIFTAAFLGMAMFQNNKNGRPWRVDMEWNTDKAARQARTDDDRLSMKTLNDVCAKVNVVLKARPNGNTSGVTWGLTPQFDRGGMICAGPGAQVEYARKDPAFAGTAYTYLTAPQRAPEKNQRADQMYIGRGAYCGLVIDAEGNIVTAMSTICTALSDGTPGMGNRWKPPADADARKTQYAVGADAATWGLIAGVSGWQATMQQTQQQGMRFYPQQNGAPVPLDKNADIVGYTHGMIRCVYETKRMGQGTAFEMSIGTDTFKLASCLSCSSFMMANDVDASSSHLGKGESWSPYYSGESHNPSYYPDKVSIGAAIAQCNDKYAKFMHACMTNGVAAMKNSPKSVSEAHGPALAALDKLLTEKAATADNTVARDLYLDAMTWHKSDAQRLNSALVYDKAAAADLWEGKYYDWSTTTIVDPDGGGAWRTFENPLTDEQVRELHRAPAALINTYQIRVWSPNKDDSCALEYALLNAEGKDVEKGKLSQAANEKIKTAEISVGLAEFTVAAANDVTKWKIRFAGDKDYSFIRLNQNTAIGSGDRYSYEITKK